MPTQVPAIKFDKTGVKIPEEKDILNGVFADFDSAFGGGLNTDLSSPQGQLAQSITAIIGNKNTNIMDMCNQFDPARNQGRWQDGIARIYFLERVPGRGTVVRAQCSGLVGSVIHEGAVAQDRNGYLYNSLRSVVIGDNGTVEVDFQNQDYGAIPCPSGTLDRIYISIVGWERITNNMDGVQGSLVESRADFEYRRYNSVAKNAHGTNPAVYAAVFEVDGVIDVYVIDNPDEIKKSFGATNYELKKHSIYVAVVGGNDANIARAIWTKKDAGCNYNGNTMVVLKDDTYSSPEPEYEVYFNRPDFLPIKFLVQVAKGDKVPSNYNALVKASIINRFYGIDGGERERIAAPVLASTYYSSVFSALGGAEILSVQVGITSADRNKVDIGIDQYPTVSEQDIEVVLI